tara:strand:+ start:542 stop:1018 length:477 start_codon:yes stop_codon:yes gene_type:complete
MSENKYIPHKFVVGEKFEAELTFDNPLRSQSTKFPGKVNIWYGVKQLINHVNGFNATESLDAMIQGLRLKKGDKIVIEKHQGDTFAYFTLNGKTKDEIISGSAYNEGNTNSTSSQPVMIENIQHDVSMDDKRRLDTLWEWYQEQTNKGEDVTTDDLPF